MIVFKNKGLLDLHAITTFGASVKESKSPIGQFGTGLKYAIAVLLRHGQDIRIIIDGQVYAFGTKVQAIRDKDFSLVQMYEPAGYHAGRQPEPKLCGFTTELGKHWELWMAYRELACNCMDESGSVSHESYAVDGEAGETVICVTGQAFNAVWQNREQYILEGAPHSVVPELLEVRHTPNSGVYYRNILVGQLPTKSLMTYNFLCNVELTEDRTAKYLFLLQDKVRRALLETTDADFIRKAICAPKHTWEAAIDFNTTAEPSQLFKKIVMEEYAKDVMKPSASAVSMVRTREKAAFRHKPMQITQVQAKTLERASEFCRKIGFEVTQYPIHVVQNLGEGILAMAVEREIWLSERVFQLGGTKAVASTLIEEFLHIDRGLRDESRDMQQFLFDKIVSMGEEALGEPL
jgi:hypothetical protein